MNELIIHLILPMRHEREMNLKIHLLTLPSKSL
jgi:hypothetical protein